MDLVRTLLNIIWLVLSGCWMFLGYVAAGVLLCVLTNLVRLVRDTQ